MTDEIFLWASYALARLISRASRAEEAREASHGMAAEDGRTTFTGEFTYNSFVGEMVLR